MASGFLPEKKIFEQGSVEFERLLAFWRFKSRKIVFTNGCFDILHRGHIDYLQKASHLGDILVIGLNTDASVRRLKGDSRPIQDEMARALVLASIQMVDAVVFFGADTPLELIRQVMPQVLVKGGDYHADDIVGAGLVRDNGGEVIVLPYLEGHSTTSIEEFILRKGEKL
jgi:rfaE bifunctional protein nucleotidyltransferase chain/domain